MCWSFPFLPLHWGVSVSTALGSSAGRAAPLLLQEAAPGLTGVLSLGFSDWSQVPGAVLGYEANSDVSGTSLCLSLLDPSRGMASYAKQLRAI